MVNPELALSVAFRGSCAALGIGFLEQISVFDQAFGPQGPFSVSVAGILGGRVSQNSLLDKALRYVLVVGAVAGIVGLIVGPYTLLGRSSLATIIICILMTKLRRVMGSDGAEQMAILTLFAVCIAALPGLDQNMIKLAVWFVGGQSILSYGTAGIAKAISPTWRRGEAISLIMGSESYGQPWASVLLEAHPRASKLLTRLVVLFECCFPLIIVMPTSIALVILVAGVAFHLGCAVSMGLNAFLLAFPSSYICVAYIAQETSPFWG